MTEDNRPAGVSQRRLLTRAGVAGAGLAARAAAGNRSYTRATFPYYAGVAGPGTYRCGG